MQLRVASRACTRDVSVFTWARKVPIDLLKHLTVLHAWALDGAPHPTMSAPQVTASKTNFRMVTSRVGVSDAPTLNPGVMRAQPPAGIAKPSPVMCAAVTARA